MKKLIVLGLAFAPVLASAQGNLGNVNTLLGGFKNLVDLALPIVVGLALLAFFWGLAKFIFAAGDPEKAKEGKSIMIWGVVALFVMTAIWGLVGFLSSALLGGNNGTTPVINTPTVNGRQS